MRKLCVFKANWLERNAKFEIGNLNSKCFFGYLELKGT